MKSNFKLRAEKLAELRAAAANDPRVANRHAVYETFAAQVEGSVPRQCANMSAWELVKYGRKHYKTDDNNQPLNKFTAYMQAVAKALFAPGDWKRPVYARFPSCGVDWAEAAMIWYHGADPTKTYEGVRSAGYRC